MREEALQALQVHRTLQQQRPFAPPVEPVVQIPGIPDSPLADKKRNFLKRSTTTPLSPTRPSPSAMAAAQKVCDWGT